VTAPFLLRAECSSPCRLIIGPFVEGLFIETG
jgi:hypothetical protein